MNSYIRPLACAINNSAMFSTGFMLHHMKHTNADCHYVAVDNIRNGCKSNQNFLGTSSKHTDILTTGHQAFHFYHNEDKTLIYISKKNVWENLENGRSTTVDWSDRFSSRQPRFDYCRDLYQWFELSKVHQTKLFQCSWIGTSTQIWDCNMLLFS